jgi:hypothetical protein
MLPGLLCAASMIHCSTAATLTLADKSEVTGKILRADAESVYLETPTGTRKILSLTIADVEHPGKGLMLIGGGLLASGLILMFGGEQKTCQADCSFPEPYNPVGLFLVWLTRGDGTAAGAVQTSDGIRNRIPLPFLNAAVTPVNKVTRQTREMPRGECHNLVHNPRS